MDTSQEQPPHFFMPGRKPEEYEEMYAFLAAQCGVSVPPPNERIYAISHRSDGDIWYAAVGKTQTARRQVQKGRKRTEQTYQITDAFSCGGQYLTIPWERVCASF